MFPKEIRRRALLEMNDVRDILDMGDVSGPGERKKRVPKPKVCSLMLFIRIEY